MIRLHKINIMRLYIIKVEKMKDYVNYRHHQQLYTTNSRQRLKKGQQVCCLAKCSQLVSQLQVSGSWNTCSSLSIVKKLHFSTGFSNQLKKFHKFHHSLCWCLTLCLDYHVEQFFIVCLSSCYHLLELGTEAIEGNALFRTATAAVLCNHLGLNQLHIKGDGETKCRSVITILGVIVS